MTASSSVTAVLSPSTSSFSAASFTAVSASSAAARLFCACASMSPVLCSSAAQSTFSSCAEIVRSESSVSASCAFSSSPVRPFTVSTSRCASSASSSAVTLSSRETICSMRGAYRRTPTKASAELAVTTMSSSMHTTAVTFCQCRRFLSSSSIGSPPSFYSSPQR